MDMAAAFPNPVVEYTVYLLAVDEKWYPVMAVSHHSDPLDDVTKIPLVAFPTPAVAEMTDRLMDDIIPMGASLRSINRKNLTSVKVGPRNDIMEYLIFDVLRYRKATVFLVFQRSRNTGKVRMMAYGSDRVLHSRAGTTLDMIDRVAVLNHLAKALHETKVEDIHASEELVDAIAYGDYDYFSTAPIPLRRV